MADLTGAKFEVEVCYATPKTTERVTVAVQSGWTLQQAILASGLLAQHSIELAESRVGIYGKLKTLDTAVRAGDRIEIYRSLSVDPNAARLRRQAKNRAEKAKLKRQVSQAGASEKTA